MSEETTPGQALDPEQVVGNAVPIADVVIFPDGTLADVSAPHRYQCPECMVTTRSTSDEPPVQPCWVPGCDGVARLKE